MTIQPRNKTKKNNKLRRSLRSKNGGVRPKMKDELMSEEFVNGMYENMWQFINPDVILFILKKAGCSTKTSRQKDINDNVFKPRHRDTICFKGSPTEGHYVYVSSEGCVTGTYENDLICTKDDGICHGGALAAALTNCGYNIGPIIKNPRTLAEKKTNYRTIMNTYLFIIHQGWWDEAVRTYFPTEASKAKTTAASNLLIYFVGNL